MRVDKLANMTKGWFVGDFTPNLIHSTDVEVAIKHYKAGDQEARHVHKIATELTAVLNGTVEMNGVQYHDGDIVVIEPGDATDFKALTDVTTVVVKNPSAPDDKYPA